MNGKGTKMVARNMTVREWMMAKFSSQNRDRSLAGPVREQPVPPAEPSAVSPEILTWEALIGQPPGQPTPPQRLPFTSTLCCQSHFALDLYRYWAMLIRQRPQFHRKQWEFVYIAQALWERDMLYPGRRGLGFGVGTEPLTSLFAKLGCGILATDQVAAEAAAQGWTRSNQHAASLVDVNRKGICPPEAFAARVRFRNVDMNAIPDDLTGFDFCWSACCFEHLGSLRHGMDFVVRSLNTLKPGGIAVHTTEYNLFSNEDTIETQHLSIYRRRDIEQLVARLDAMGHHVEPLNLDAGKGLVDGYIDLPPYRREPHLRLQIDRFACTSLGLIIRKAG